MRAKTAVLEEALTGHFEDHHGFLLQAMLDHIDALTAQIDNLGARDRGGDRPFLRARGSGWMRSPESAPPPPRN